VVLLPAGVVSPSPDAMLATLLPVAPMPRSLVVMLVAGASVFCTLVVESMLSEVVIVGVIVVASLIVSILVVVLLVEIRGVGALKVDTMVDTSVVVFAGIDADAA
jgi:hypothetical protein